MKITDTIRYAGVNDHQIDLFEGQYKVPNGMAYNSYVILAVGRIVGETAALLYTSGTVAAVPDSLMGSGRTLSVHMYSLTSEALYMDQAYATAVVLLVVVIAINAFSSWVAKRIKKV